MSDLQPTFAGKWDRLTYLLAEYKVLVSVLFIGAGAWFAYVRPELPSVTVPTWAVAYIVAFVLAAPIAYPAGLKIVGWLRSRNRVTVHHVNAVEDAVEKYLVAPETWASKTVEGADPYPINDGEAWAVREFEYHEEPADLVVTGVWLSSTADTELLTSKNHMEEIHGWLVGKYRELASVRDRISRLSVEIQESIINASAEARERGEMIEPTAVEEAVKNAKSDVPTPGEEDLPSLEDSIKDDAMFQDLSPNAEHADLDDRGETNGHGEQVTVAVEGGEP